MRRFYPNLKNHPSVFKYEDVRGVSKSMLFFNHAHPETKQSNSTSFENDFEAKMVGFKRISYI